MTNPDPATAARGQPATATFTAAAANSHRPLRGPETQIPGAPHGARPHNNLRGKGPTMPHYRVHAAATVEAADDADVTVKLDRLACLVCDTEFADWSLEAELVEDADHCPACGPHADDGHLPDCPTADEHDNPLHGIAYANLNGPIERDDELAVYATDEHAAHALDALGFAWRIIVDHPPTEPPPSCEIYVRRTEREARALVHELETNGSTAIAIANNRLVPDAEEDDD